MYVSLSIYIYIYIYIYTYLNISLSIIYIYIYMYILGKKGFQSAKSGGGEQFLLPGSVATAFVKAGCWLAAPLAPCSSLLTILHYTRSTVAMYILIVLYN